MPCACSWATHPGYVEAISSTVRRALLNQFSPEERDQVVIVFSAHSLPLKVVAKGDQYPPEIAATVSHVVSSLQLSNPYVVAWQSKGMPARTVVAGPTLTRAMQWDTCPGSGLPLAMSCMG